MFINISPTLLLICELIITTAIISGIINRVFLRFVNVAIVFLLTTIFLYASGNYADYIYETNPMVFISFGLSFWLSLFFMYIILIDSIKEYAILLKLSITTAFMGLILVLLLSGLLDKIDVVREFYSRYDRFINELIVHINLSLASVTTAFVFSMFLGIASYKKPSVAKKVFTVLNIIQTIPSLAAFGALMIPLAYLSGHFKILSDIGVSGIGYAPAFIALVLYAMLPMVRNVYTGLNGIPKEIKDASLGLGMDCVQLLFLVEIPLSMIEILTGFKIALVQTIGNAALAALIGAGGLGVFIFQGLGEASNSLIMLGVMPLVGLAILSDIVMNFIIFAVSKKYKKGSVID